MIVPHLICINYITADKKDDKLSSNITKNCTDILSIITEERSSQLNNSTILSDKSVTFEEAVGVSFSFDGKEVSISLYETPNLTEEEALQVVEMYANELTERISGKCNLFLETGSSASNSVEF